MACAMAVCVLVCLCVCAPAGCEILVVTQRAGRRERRRIVFAMLDDRAGRAMRRAGLWQGGVGGYASWGSVCVAIGRVWVC